MPAMRRHRSLWPTHRLMPRCASLRLVGGGRCSPPAARYSPNRCLDRLGHGRRAVRQSRGAGRHDIGDHPRARIDADADAPIEVAGNEDRVAVRIDAGDHPDMAAVLAAREHRDGADARPGKAPAVMEEGLGGLGMSAGIAELGQDEVHEGGAPKPFAVGRIGAEISARLGDQHQPGSHGRGDGSASPRRR
jgi:hypothetical protein